MVIMFCTNKIGLKSYSVNIIEQIKKIKEVTITIQIIDTGTTFESNIYLVCFIKILEGHHKY